jgi:hypothetical protein
MKASLSQHEYFVVRWLKAKTPELILGALVFLYVYSVSGRVFSDFWSDEIYTLKHFVLVPLSVTMGDYHVPNNHVLFSIMLNVWTTFLGLETLHDVFVSPYLVRCFPLCFSIVAVFITYRIGEYLCDSWLGIVAASILVFSISFFEFGIQLRGYSLSICLVAAIILMSFKLMNQSKVLQFVYVVVLTAMLGYTIPLNYYFLLGLFLTIIGKAGLGYLRSGCDKKSALVEFTRSAPLALALIIGVALSLLLYLPILQEVFVNQYVEGKGFDLNRTIKVFYLVIGGFLSRRTGILVLAAIGICWVLRKKQFSDEFGDVVFLGAVFITAFIISAVKGDNPPPRAFVNLVPVFSIGVGWLIYRVCQKISLTQFAVVVFCLIGALEHYYERDRLESLVRSNLEKTRGPSRPQELNYGYYSYGYQPLADIRAFERHRTSGRPLIIGDAEPNGLSEYLGAMGIEHILTGLSIPDVDGRPWEGPGLDELARRYPGGFYFVTRFHNRLYRSLVESGVPSRVTSISKKPTYHNFFYIEPGPVP